jgi:hypothetical protein
LWHPLNAQLSDVVQHLSFVLVFLMILVVCCVLLLL